MRKKVNRQAKAVVRRKCCSEIPPLERRQSPSEKAERIHAARIRHIRSCLTRPARAVTVPQKTHLRWLLAFIFAFADALQNREAVLLSVGYGKGSGRIEAGPHLANRFFAGRAFRQRGGGEWATEGELAAADFAVTLTEFVFVKRHCLDTKGNIEIRFFARTGSILDVLIGRITSAEALEMARKGQ